MTDLIIVADIDLQNKDGDELYSDARRRGDFDVDYHYVIHRDGHVEQGREQMAVGGLYVDPQETSIIVFVDVSNGGEETDVQKKAVNDLLGGFKIDFRDADVARVKGEYIPVNYAEYACTSAFTVR
jgi:hypothetical protein